MLIHVVLFKLKMEHLTPAQQNKEWAHVLSLGQDLGRKCGGINAGIIFWAFNPSEDKRKGVEWVEVSCFTCRTALANFRAHPAHLEFVERVKMVADWDIGDILV